MESNPTTEYGVGEPILAPTPWRPIPRWKWIKRLQGYRWERWAAVTTKTPYNTFVLIYGSDLRVAHDHLDEEFRNDA